MQQFESIAVASILRCETVESIGRFTIVWNLFEHHYMGNNAHEAGIYKLPLSFIDDIDTPEINTLIENYRTAVRHYFNVDYRDLNDEMISRVFYPSRKSGRYSSEIKDFFDYRNNSFKACLCSICRIRNNMLHGEKDVYSINYQIDIIIAATEILSYLVKDDTLDLLAKETEL